MSSGLPPILPKDDRNQLFNRYLNKNISYKPSDFDALVSYFLKRGFEQTSAINTSVILLEQASIDKLNVQQIIDTLSGLNEVQLSKVVATILNYNRPKSSKIGYKINPNPDLFEERNIIE